MKSPLFIGVSALTLLAVSATLFAQTTTGSSLITQMKAATHAFTLAADLNSGATGLESSPLVGKRTGDMLSAGEYNRILELVGQGGGGGGLKICGENENCPGTVLLCGGVSPEPAQTTADRIQIVSSLEQPVRPITFGTWSNTQCGKSGTGWHVSLASCSTGTGTGFGKCEWVLVDTGGGGGGGGGTGSGLGYGQTWQNMKGSAVGCAGPRISGTICTNNTGKPIQVNVSAAATEGQNVITFYCYAGTGTDIFLGLAQRFWNGMGDSVGSVSFVVPVGGVYHCDMASNLPSTVTWSHWVELR